MANNNILQYESKVWATADLLIGAGIKQSDFPKYMMPFFAVIMVESRLIRESNKLLQDYGVESISDLNKEDLEDFIEEFSDNGLGYNDFVIRKGKRLADVCKNDKTFDVDYYAYLKSFDLETKSLLGVDKGNEEEKFMNISGVSGLLKKKKILFATVQAWSQIDLISFNNSEITTLEEHIKRKWADISAETAGEQYTPDDVIALISEIILSKIENNDKFLTIYDPTCGGGNMLFGVEDKINEKFNRPIKTFGEDWNDTLYALAKIESRFREDSVIEYGNSLTGLKFSDKQFNVIVANPPYGIPWKGFAKEIQNDQTNRFIALPSIGDGQLLFAQHILSQLDNDGIAIEVHSGSSIFSGDAGSGDSNIRKHFFDNDYVEAIIQMPTEEFFNTGIHTYLWIFNKKKPSERKDKLIMIDASNHYSPMKKNKGLKRKEMLENDRSIIVKTLFDFKNTEFAQVHDKWSFYYNKQSIILTNLDENDKSYESELEDDTKSTRLHPTAITQVDDEGQKIEISNFIITEFEKKKYDNLKTYNDNYIKPLLGQLDFKEFDLKVKTTDALFYYDSDKETLVKEVKEKKKELGCGKITLKSQYKKATKTKGAQIVITTELIPDYQKDYEIIPYSPDVTENELWVTNFMAKHVTKPFRYSDRIIGVEVNFNKLFYRAEQLTGVATILDNLDGLEKELKKLEIDLAI